MLLILLCRSTGFISLSMFTRSFTKILDFIVVVVPGLRSGARSHPAQATAATEGASVSVESASASTSENLLTFERTSTISLRQKTTNYLIVRFGTQCAKETPSSVTI